MIIRRNITPPPSGSGINLEEREFARADYAGLDNSAQIDLRSKRHLEAQKLWEARQASNNFYNKTLNNIRRNDDLTLDQDKLLRKEALEKRNREFQSYLNSTKNAKSRLRNSAVSDMKYRQRAVELNKKAGKNSINKFLSNPKKMAGAGLGLATIGGIVGYNHYKNKRRDN